MSKNIAGLFKFPNSPPPPWQREISSKSICMSILSCKQYKGIFLIIFLSARSFFAIFFFPYHRYYIILLRKLACRGTSLLNPTRTLQCILCTGIVYFELNIRKISDYNRKPKEEIKKNTKIQKCVQSSPLDLTEKI